MKIRNMLLIAGMSLIAACSLFKEISKEESIKTQTAKVHEAECKSEIEIVKEEARRISEEIKSKEIVYAVDDINYEICKIETNWFQPPHITEKIRRGDCKDLSFLLNYRLNKKGVNDYHTVFGRTDGFPHAWGMLQYRSNNYFVCPQSGIVTDINNISDKFYVPDPQLSDYKREKIAILTNYPGCRNLKFNDDLSKSLHPFGVPMEIRIVRGEVDKMKGEFDSGKLVYYIPQTNIGGKIKKTYVNYETWKPESNYFQPPFAFENGRTGSCKGISALLSYRLEKMGVTSVYNILGTVYTNYLHAWNEFHFAGREFMMWGNRGLFIEKSQISNLYFEPYLEISPEVMERIREFKKRPGCQNLKFNFDLPKERLKPYGIRPGNPGRN